MINYKDGLNNKEYNKISLICDKNMTIDELCQLIKSKREKNNGDESTIIFCGNKINFNLNLSQYDANLLKKEVFYIDYKIKNINFLYENKNYTFYISDENDIPY